MGFRGAVEGGVECWLHTRSLRIGCRGVYDGVAGISRSVVCKAAQRRGRESTKLSGTGVPPREWEGGGPHRKTLTFLHRLLDGSTGQAGGTCRQTSNEPGRIMRFSFLSSNASLRNQTAPPDHWRPFPSQEECSDACWGEQPCAARAHLCIAQCPHSRRTRG